jgi:hypothetical protein
VPGNGFSILHYLTDGWLLHGLAGLYMGSMGSSVRVVFIIMEINAKERGWDLHFLHPAR